MRYNWQHPQWPSFTYDAKNIEFIIQQYILEVGQTLGIAQSIDEESGEEVLVGLMVEEALKTSQIEGEDIKASELRSSIRNQMGLSIDNSMVSDPRARGIAELMLNVRTSFHQPLSASILWKWHDLIIQDPYQRQYLEVGGWRTNPSPMQIVSGAIGKETIFFEAPPSSQVPKEMDHFIKWFNQTDPAVVGKNHLHGVVRAAISHLYFESIHPFADGNGRIGRAIAEKALSQDLGLPVFLTLSKIIYQKRKSYYQELSKASAYTVDMTEWIFFFITCVLEAQIDAKETFLFVIKKTKFWKRYQSILNERQTKVVRRIMEEGKAGFKGGMTPKKYMILTDCSKATATRDLSDLFKKGCFIKSEEEGRSTFYNINLNSTSTSF